jgi:CubicO group peptidase (beta-lactamase class C family)
MWILIIVFGFILFGCSNKPKIERIDGSKIKKEELTENIKSLMGAAHVTGLAVSIFNNNEVVYQKAFGYENAGNKDTLEINSIFYGASLSKAVFSHLVMQLVEENKISLDTPLQNYLDRPLSEYEFNRNWKGYSDLEGDNRYKQITARMCLSHTTGLPNWRFLTKNGFDINGKLHFLFNPGERYSYSGEGISLLQFVVENITGIGLEQLAQERLFTPLEMDRTSYIYVLKESYQNEYAYGHDKNQTVIPFDEVDEAGAAGTMGTTLVNYSQFIETIFKQKYLSKALYDEMFEQQISINSKQQFGPNALIQTNENRDINLGYGLGWGVLYTPFGKGAFKEGHAEGFQHYSIIFPEKQIGMVILSNSENGESIFKELLEVSIGDTFTPWKWENYIPYNQEE